jgi:hypothetical protein
MRNLMKKHFGCVLLLLTGGLSILTHNACHGETIAGEVKLIGDRLASAAVRVSRDQDYCGEILPDETYLTDSTGGLKNVVVSIDAATPTVADPQKVNFLDNDGCRYFPRILAMQKGERLKVRNKDPKLHIPHSYLGERTVFILSLPFRGTSLEATQRIREPGILKIVCDTHAWMLAYIHVFDHPFFAITDAQGRFLISNVPAGTYVIKAWHEDAGVRTQEVTVSEDGATRVDFEFTKR